MVLVAESQIQMKELRQHEPPAVTGNAFQLFASATGAFPLENNSERASSTEDFEMVDSTPGNFKARNQTAGLTMTNVESGQPAQRVPATPTQNFLNEIQGLKQLVSKHRSDVISLEITGSQLESDNQELKVELSRVRMQLAKMKTESAKRKGKYDALLDDVQLGSDKLSKKLVQYKRENDQLESQLKTDLEAQKVFWQEINKQLHNENERSLEEITALKEDLEGEKAGRAQAKQDAKREMNELDERHEEALTEKADIQIKLERLEMENAKLRQEKTQQVANYEERISQMGSKINLLPPAEEDQFTTDDMLRMMREQLGDEDFGEEE